MEPFHFIIDLDKVSLLKENKLKVQRLFDVEVGFDLVTKADSERQGKQWVSIRGAHDDKQNAKEYILSICQPKEEQTWSSDSDVQVPKHTVESVEKQTQAFVKYQGSGRFQIKGTELSVILAISMLEDLVQKEEQEDDSPKDRMEMETSPALTPNTQKQHSPWAQQLDSTLRLVLSQNSEGTTLEDYNRTPTAVKRSMLHLLSQGVGDDGKYDDVNEDLLFDQNSWSSSGAGRKKDVSSLPESMDIENTYVNDLKNSSDDESKIVTDGGSSPGPAVANLSKKFHQTNLSQLQQPEFLSKHQEFLKSFGETVGYSASLVNQVLMRENVEQMQPSDFIEELAKLDQASDDIDGRVSSVTTGGNPEKSSFPPPPNIDNFASPSKTERRSLPQDYKKQLAKDFTEESEDLSIDELKNRSRNRRQMLQGYFPEQEDKSSSWTVVKGPKSSRSKGQLPATPAETIAEAEDDVVVVSDTEETCVMKVWHSDSDSQVSDNGEVEITGYSPAKVVPIVSVGRRSPRGGKHQNYNQCVSPRRPNVAKALNAPKPMNVAPSLLRSPSSHGNLRFVVIDGSNVAMTHGNGKVFSCRGIEIAIQHFLQRGHREVCAFVPHWRKASPHYTKPIKDQDLLTKLQEDGYLCFTPSRKINGRLQSSYDDRFVLDLAEREDGVIVSNDQYRDLMETKASWKKLIEERLLMFTFVKDNFMLPDDPHGPDGPSLTQLLQKTPNHQMMGKRAHSPEKLVPFPPPQNHPYQPQQYQLHQQQQQQQIPFRHQQQHQGVNNRPLLMFPPPSHLFPSPAGFTAPSHPPGMNYARAAHHQTPQNHNQRQPQKQSSPSAWAKNNGTPRRGRGARGGANPNRSIPGRNQSFDALENRSSAKTEEIFGLLRDIFSEPDQEPKIREILQNHPSETSINKLTNYCMSVFFPQ